MSILIPDSVFAYSPLETDNLKIALTPLPTVQSAGVADDLLAASPQGAAGAAVTLFQESGAYTASAFDDWYYRIHLLPAPAGIADRDLRVACTALNAGVEACAISTFGDEPDDGSAATPPPTGSPAP